MNEKKIFAVCDLEVEYAYHFMEYLSRKKAIPFEARVFTSRETFLQYAKKNPVELLLISEKALCEEINDLDIGQTIVLAEVKGSAEYGPYPSVYKYQSSGQVIRETMVQYGKSHQEEAAVLPLAVGKKEIIGIYSPVGRTMKTTFALTLGQILAKERAVLYVNLEEYSGFEYLLEHSYEQDLGDLLYYLRQNTPNLGLRLSGIVQSMNNLDFLPPVLSPADILHTRSEEWLRLLQVIEKESSYETVILDLGDGVSELCRILERCKKVYMPVRNDPVSQAKVKQFEKLIELSCQSGLADQIQKLHLPYHRNVHRGMGYLDDLVWSELGDYVRELLRKEKGEKGE